MPSKTRDIFSRHPLITDPTSKNFLHRLPPEIRLMIYNLTLLHPSSELKRTFPAPPDRISTLKAYEKKYGPFSPDLPSKILHPAPELLAALREFTPDLAQSRKLVFLETPKKRLLIRHNSWTGTDPDLYPEALVVFYKINRFPLTKDSFVIFDELSRRALRLIERIAIFFTKDDIHYYTTRLTHSPCSKLYRSVTNLKHVEIIVDRAGSPQYTIYDAMNRCMARYWRNVDFFVLRYIELDDGHWMHSFRKKVVQGLDLRDMLTKESKGESVYGEFKWVYGDKGRRDDEDVEEVLEVVSRVGECGVKGGKFATRID